MSAAELVVVLAAFLLCALIGALLIGRALRDRSDNPETVGNMILLAALFVALAAAGIMAGAPALEELFRGCC